MHRAALQRQPERGVDRPAVLDRADAPAAAQVADDELQVGPAHPLLRPLGQIFDRRAVEAVAADVVFAGNVDGDGIVVRLGRHRAVERGLKRADERRIWQKRAELADGSEVRRVVRGGDGAEVLHPREHVVGQQLHAAHAPGQHDLEPDAVQRPQVGQHGLLQLQQHPFDGLAVRGEDGRLVDERAVFLRFRVKPPRVRPDALRPAGRRDQLLRHPEQLILQRRTAHIADQNIHTQAPCFFLYCTRFPPQYQCGKHKEPLRGELTAKLTERSLQICSC